MASGGDSASIFERETSAKLSQDWIREALAERGPAQDGLTDSQYLFWCFLYSDLNSIGRGCFPQNVKEIIQGQLAGEYISQVDEIVNIAAPIKQRYKPATKGRCLKLHLTDGLQKLQAIEMNLIPALHPLMPAGLKVAICNPEVRRGLLLLRPENVHVLGGQVAHLEEARQKMLQRWAEPVDGSQQNLLNDMTHASWRNADGDASVLNTGPAQRPTTTAPAGPTQHATAPSTAGNGSNLGARNAGLSGSDTGHGLSDFSHGNQFRAPLENPRAQAATPSTIPASSFPQAARLSHPPGSGPSGSWHTAPARRTEGTGGLGNGSWNGPVSSRNTPQTAPHSRGSLRPSMPNFDDELPGSQSQTVGRPGVAGFSRGAARAGLPIMSQRPSNLGPRRTSGHTQATENHQQAAAMSRDGLATGIFSQPSPPSTDSPATNVSNGYQHNHQQATSMADWPEDDNDDMADGSNEQEEPEAWDNDARRGRQNAPDIPRYRDIVPDTEMQDFDWQDGGYEDPDFKPELAPDQPVNDLDSPVRELSQGTGGRERISSAASTPEGLVESHSRKRPRLSPIEEILDITSPSPSPPPNNRGGQSSSNGQAPVTTLASIHEEEEDVMGFVDDELPSRLGDAVLSPEHSDYEESKPTTHRPVRFLVESSPESAGKAILRKPREESEEEENWHAASDGDRSPPVEGANGAATAEPRRDKNISGPQATAQTFTECRMDTASGLPVKAQEDVLEASPEPDYVSLAEFDRRLRGLHDHEMALDCVVHAKIQSGTKLSVRSKDGKPHFAMDVVLHDDLGLKLQTSLLNDWIEQFVGVDAGEALRRLQSGDQSVRSNFDNLTKQLANFKGVVQLQYETGMAKPVIVNLSRDSPSEMHSG